MFTGMQGLKSEKGAPVPLKGISLNIKISGYVAEVESTLKYCNEEDDPVEATFTFPTDDGSAVFKFEADIEDRHIAAEIQEKEQALLTYQDAVDHGKTAMLLKEDDTSGDIFQCMLGNLPPHCEATLALTYVVQLPQEPDGRVRFTLPTILNPRYSPDAGFSMPAEGATYVPPCKIPYTFDMTATVHGYYKVTSVKSNKVMLDVEYLESNETAKVKLADDFKFDHDLCLLVEYEKPYAPQILLEKGNQESGGLLKEDMLMVSFHPHLEEVSMANSGEYIFVIDRSGSMSGVCMKNAKEALLLFLKSLPSECYFNIISFGSRHKFLFSQGSKMYTEKSMKEAIALQTSMDANMGGTEILAPLEQAFKKKIIPDHPRRMFILTDGEVSNQDAVIGLVKNNVKNTRVFVVGIGSGVSTSLVNGIARAGNGKAEFISDSERIQPKVVSLLKCAMQPAVTDIEFVWDLPPGITHIPVPSETPAIVSAGEQLTLFAILQDINHDAIYASSSVTLKGQMENKPINYALNFNLSDDSDTVANSAPVHRLATKTQIKLLQDEEAALISSAAEDYINDKLDGKVKEVRHKIVVLSRHGNIISKHTSFVAVDKNGETFEGTMKQRQCPVPTLTREYIESLNQNSMLRCNLMSCGSAGIEEGFDAVDGVDGAATNLHHAMPQSRKGIANGSSIFNFFSCGLKKKKKKGKSASYTEAVEATLDVADGIHEVDVADGILVEDSDGENISNLPRISPGKKLDDTAMLNVISLQHLQGNWSLTPDLVAMLGVTMDSVLSVNIVKDNSAVCTFSVIYWLRKNFNHRREEWQMIEAKALSWLSSQELGNKKIEDLVTDIGEKVWPATIVEKAPQDGEIADKLSPEIIVNESSAESNDDKKSSQEAGPDEMSKKDEFEQDVKSSPEGHVAEISINDKMAEAESKTTQVVEVGEVDESGVQEKDGLLSLQDANEKSASENV